jgi:3-hydroxybutyrate dehydrogenase
MLNNKTALITGSTSGIGLATAHVLAKAGCNIILHGLLSETEGQALAEQFCLQYQIKSLFDGADLRQASAIQRLFSRAQQHIGTIDILVNNAGIQHTAPIESFPAEQWQAIIDINLSAAFHTLSFALPHMKQNNWGRIINIASVHGLVASKHKAAYVAAKHGIIGLTKVTALECAEFNITSNAICPGWVDTPLIQQQIANVAEAESLDFEQAKKRLLTSKQPVPTMTQPEQIGELVLYLCSEHARTITGASLPIDGAWTAQ